jgi:hypothetical protein
MPQARCVGPHTLIIQLIIQFLQCEKISVQQQDCSARSLKVQHPLSFIYLPLNMHLTKETISPKKKINK